MDYYKLKWAITHVVQPKSILEIGVRYGYSALAFLDASPQASYVGIDANIPEFGGEVGALDWARKKLGIARASIYEINSKNLTAFNGEL